MPWFRDFRDEVVVVTGASSGIGRETARAFGAVGARVALLSRRRSVLGQVAKEIRQAGGESLVVPVDVTQRSSVRAALRTARDHFGRIDVVINSAGVLVPALVTELKPADLNAMLRVNLFGALFVMQQAVRIMQEQEDGGCIVNVASLAGRRGVSPIGGYCASKFALVGLTEALRIELHDSNIHVGLVMPGVIDTPMAHEVTDNQEFNKTWPSALNMPPSWVVWAIFAAARFRLVEISVPPGTATLEKLAALVPGLTDSLIHWGKTATEVASQLLTSRGGGPPRRGRV